MILRSCLVLCCAIQSAACNAPREIQFPDGTVIRDFGQLGGDHALLIENRNPDGTSTKFAWRSKQAKSLQDVAQATVAGIGLKQAGYTERLRSNNHTESTAVRTAAGVEKEKIKAATEQARIQADLQKDLSRLIQTRP